MGLPMLTLQYFRVSDSISLNAAVFAAVCLASRLSTSLDTFSLLLCAIQLFVFFPNFRRTVKVTMPESNFRGTYILWK